MLGVEKNTSGCNLLTAFHKQGPVFSTWSTDYVLKKANSAEALSTGYSRGKVSVATDLKEVRSK